jgi:hypothetical protein
VVVDLHKYEIARNTINLYIDKNRDMPLGLLINNCCIMTSIPLVVVCFYIGDHVGFTPELEHHIKVLTEFYKYDNIVGRK